MPIVVNTNSAATTASFNLSKSSEALRKSLGRLSSGKRIMSPADDAGGLAVALKLASKTNRTAGVIQNVQNALSYMQVQDSSLQTVGKILDRIAELRTMAQDITKNTGDIENYSKEFVELQSQLKQIKNETFNGISLFSSGTANVANDPTLNAETGALTANVNGVVVNTFDRYGRILFTHPGGQTNDGSISINVTNLEYVLEVGTLSTESSSYWDPAGAGKPAQNINLGNVASDQTAGGGGGGPHTPGSGGSASYGGGASPSSGAVGTNGVANSGGGGGSGAYYGSVNYLGGAGGSGIVVIRYAV